jgi:DNA-nicking Smr family endonuclease
MWALLTAALRREPPATAPDDAEPDDGELHHGDADQPAAIEIEDSIDLHGFQPRDVVSVVESYLEAAHDKGLREVRLIHGKGKGVQRRRVQSLLSRHPLVERFAEAPPTRGGWGATIVWLCPPTSRAS